MLELRPNCEYCDKDLPPDSTEACICTYECTFCRDCVDTVLHNVCPNRGGGLPLAPSGRAPSAGRGVSLAHQPAGTQRIHTAYSPQETADFVAGVKDIPPRQR